MKKEIEKMKLKLDEFDQTLNEKGKKKSHLPKTNLGFGLKISLDFVASIIVGVLIGIGIDKLFDTKPIFFLIFLLLGIGAGFMNIYRVVLDLEKKKE